MRRIKTIAVLSLALSVVEGLVSAQTFTPQEVDLARRDPEYFKITTTEVVPLASDPLPIPTPPVSSDVPSLDDISTIINIGKQVWAIIVANKPVVDVKNSFAAAMPQGISRAEQLAGWKAPEGTTYELRAKNTYGMEVVRLRYQVLRTVGGRYKGRGRFLTAVTVQPIAVDVMWGYRFSVSAAAPSTTNAGTDREPVAGMMLTLDWKIETPIKESRGTGVYYVQGDGTFKDVSGGLQRRPQLDLRKFGSFSARGLGL